MVIKADGLAAGKGVIIAADKGESDKAIDFMFEGGFGDSGARDRGRRIHGRRGSQLLRPVSDGTNVMPLAGAQDHKRVGDGDTGPNTGGMGAYSPAPVLTPALEQVAMEQFIKPTVAALAARGMPYMGVLYLGLMITKNGPKLVEYNCRFGDPECQVLMPRLKSDLLTALLAARDGKLATAGMARRGGADRGDGVQGLSRRLRERPCHYRAGRSRADARHHHLPCRHRKAGQRHLAVGGRVLDVTAMGKDVAEAQARAYAAVAKSTGKALFTAHDIGWRALKR